MTVPPQDIVPALAALKDVADELYWCIEDRYRAMGDQIIKRANELVTFCSYLTADEAEGIVAALELVLAPVRRRRAVELAAQANSLIAAIYKTIEDN